MTLHIFGWRNKETMVPSYCLAMFLRGLIQKGFGTQLLANYKLSTEDDVQEAVWKFIQFQSTIVNSCEMLVWYLLQKIVLASGYIKFLYALHPLHSLIRGTRLFQSYCELWDGWVWKNNGWIRHFSIWLWELYDQPYLIILVVKTILEASEDLKFCWMDWDLIQIVCCDQGMPISWKKKGN